MSITLSPKAISAVANAAAQILGEDHPLIGQITGLTIDPDDAHLVYSAIEALPELERRALAGIVADHLMPGLTPKGPYRH